MTNTEEPKLNDDFSFFRRSSIDKHALNIGRNGSTLHYILDLHSRVF